MIPIPTFHKHFGGQVRPDDIAPYVLVPGSKKRVLQIAQLWDKAREVVDFHEFLIYTGEMSGVPVTACSTGIGGSSVVVAVQGLVALGAHTLIRVGVTGTLQENIEVGDLTIASAAIRADRISGYFVSAEIPALSSHEVLLALAAACQNRKYTFHVGVTATNGSFYCGEGRPGANGYTQSFMTPIVEDFVKSGVLDWDTETAALFSLAAALGARAGRINGVLDSPRSKKTDPEAENRAVQAALEAVLILSNWDLVKARSNQDYLLPAIPKQALR